MMKGAFLLILFTPLAFPGFFPFDVNLILAVSAAFVFISISLFGQKTLYLPKAFILALGFILCLQIFLILNGNVLAPQIWQLQTIGYLAAAGLLITGISVHVSSLQSWMQLYMIAAALWSGIGLFVWLGGTAGFPLEIGSVTLAMAPALKISGPFNQGNIFATAIGFAWMFSHWLFMRSGKPEYALGTIFFTAMLFDTLSKGGWLTFVLAITLLLFALKPTPSIIIKKIAPLWLAGITLGLVFLEFSQPAGEPDAFLSVVQPAASLEARLLIWGSAFAEFLNAPWTGLGWGQFPVEFWSANIHAQAWLADHFGLSNSLYGNAMSAHNILLQVMAEAGVFALLLLLWGIWRLLRANTALLVNGNSSRLPFALAALAFLIQSQFNISYTQPVPMLMAAFFSGIALAPWLRRNSWRIKCHFIIRGSISTIALISILWAGQLTQQWFSAEQAIRNFKIQNESSIRDLAAVAVTPRIGAIPLIWLGYNIATTQQHSRLLTWMLPYLKQSTHEIPFVDAYQVQFYALTYSQQMAEACQLGQVISARNLPGEKNERAYQQACEGKRITSYEFGH